MMVTFLKKKFEVLQPVVGATHFYKLLSSNGCQLKVLQKLNASVRFLKLKIPFTISGLQKISGDDP